MTDVVIEEVPFCGCTNEQLEHGQSCGQPQCPNIDTAKDPVTHNLTYIENDEQGYGDGLQDVYRCDCGEKFQANGDIAEAYEHGYDVGLDHGLECDEPSSHPVPEWSTREP